MSALGRPVACWLRALLSAECFPVWAAWCLLLHAPNVSGVPDAALVQTQGAMQQQMADKLAAVLDHFVNEVGALRW